MIPLGWAQGNTLPKVPSDPTSTIEYHANGFGVIPFDAKVVKTEKYAEYAKKAAQKVRRQAPGLQSSPALRRLVRRR